MKIHPDLKPGNKFPNFKLPDQDGSVLKLSQHIRGWPTIIVFYRDMVTEMPSPVGELYPVLAARINGQLLQTPGRDRG